MQNAKEVGVLRELAKEYRAIAMLPRQEATAQEWKRHNRLLPGKPMLFMKEIPWHEIPEVHGLVCQDPLLRQAESFLRRNIYQWKHMRGDMVIDGKLSLTPVIHDSGFGVVAQEVERAGLETKGAKHFVPVIKSEEDIALIKTPRLFVDWEASKKNLEKLGEAVGDLIPVVNGGVKILWAAPWDVLIQWIGIEATFLKMVTNPQFIHKAIGRLLDCYLARLDQYEELGILGLNNGNDSVGSGGLCFSDELPQADFDGAHVRPQDMWGTSAAQLFAGVSPAMHAEFALQYERKWLDRFGLVAYGCCEPLHRKIEILRSLPQLRRISISPWADLKEAAASIGTDYILSAKPNPALLAADAWDPELVRQEIREALQVTSNCIVELTLKDITTCRNEPERLWEWMAIATEEALRSAE